MSPPATIALVEDHSLLAESLVVALGGEGFDVQQVSVPDRPADVTALVESILVLRPRLVLLDLDLGAAGDGVRAVRPLVAARCAVVVVTGSRDRARWGECLAKGAQTVLAKSAGLDEIVDTMRQVLDGSPAMPQDRRQELVECWQQREAAELATRSRLARLSPREREVLTALSAGRQVRDIADASYVSEATVRTQVKSILFKLGVSSQIAAVAIARDADAMAPR